MKLKWINFIFLTLIGFSLSACAFDESGQLDKDYVSSYPSQILVGDVYILKDREAINGDIVGFNTTLVVEEGAQVNGEIILFGSKAEISGQINGDMNLFGVETHVLETAIVSGSVNQIASTLYIDPGASISGDINTFSNPEIDQEPSFEIPAEAADIFRPRTWVLFQIFRNIVLILFNMLIVFLFKDQTLRVVNQLKKQPLVSWAIGLLAFIAIPLISIFFMITICLSPIGIILIIALILVNLWGWTITSYYIGDQITKWLKLEWSEAGIVAAGSVLFGIFFVLIAIIPFASIFMNIIISAFGCGAVILLLLRRKTPVR